MASNTDRTYTGSLSGKRKSTTDAKGLSRPRRKKARRACSACQKSHQTCGNERPCGSCVKRGMAESCRDGIRKKPKYLEDGSYRVFTIQCSIPYSNVQFAPPIELSPSPDIGAQSTLPDILPAHGFYACPDLSPWNLCAEDPFIGQDLNCDQLEMGDTCYMDSPQSDVSDKAEKPNSLLAFAIGSGWSSTFLQSESGSAL